MDTNLDRVPSRITRDAFTKIFTDIGIDPTQVTAMEFRPDGAYVTVFAEDPNGRRAIIRGVDEGFAKHRIYIPVDDGDPDEVAKNAHAALTRDRHNTADNIRAHEAEWTEAHK